MLSKLIKIKDLKLFNYKPVISILLLLLIVSLSCLFLNFFINFLSWLDTDSLFKKKHCFLNLPTNLKVKLLEMKKQ